MRQLSKFKKFTGTDLANSQGEGALFNSVWTFVVGPNAGPRKMAIVNMSCQGELIPIRPRRSQWAEFVALSASVFALLVAAPGCQVRAQSGPPRVVEGHSAKSGPSPDLAVSSIGVTPTGFVSYQVVNRGENSTGSPFVADVFIDGVRKDTIKHDPLPGHGQQTAQSALARLTGCKVGNVRVVVDAQNTVAESDETNNQTTKSLVPPCPDLTATIREDPVDNHLRYQIKVTVTNQGNLATPGKFVVLVAAGSDPHILFQNLPVQAESYLGPLAAGESKSFHVGGKHLATTTTWVRVLVDFYKTTAESNEDNNEVRRTLGPH